MWIERRIGIWHIFGRLEPTRKTFRDQVTFNVSPGLCQNSQSSYFIIGFYSVSSSIFKLILVFALMVYMLGFYLSYWYKILSSFFQIDFLCDTVRTKSRHYTICMNGYTYFQDGNFHDIHDSIKKFYHQFGLIYSTFSSREEKCCGFCTDYVTDCNI